MRIKEFLFALILSILMIGFAFNLNNVSGYQVGRSNESIQAAGLIDKAILCMDEMQNREIGLGRVNESLQEALQLYAGQVALENQGRIANYKMINEDAKEVCTIRDNALKAQDELIVFNDSYNAAKVQINLSAMDKEYSDVIKSFFEERFEDTPVLIDKAYTKLSEVQSSQTALKLFYETTTRTIKDFLIENWKSLSTGVIIAIALLIIFWKVMKRFVFNSKLKNLYVRRSSIEELIRKMQYEYFKKKSLSEAEFSVKLNAFKEMIRSIDAKIPELKDSLARIDKGGYSQVKAPKGKKRAYKKG